MQALNLSTDFTSPIYDDTLSTTTPSTTTPSTTTPSTTTPSTTTPSDTTSPSVSPDTGNPSAPYYNNKVLFLGFTMTMVAVGGLYYYFVGRHRNLEVEADANELNQGEDAPGANPPVIEAEANANELNQGEDAPGANPPVIEAEANASAASSIGASKHGSGNSQHPNDLLSNHSLSPLYHNASPNLSGSGGVDVHKECYDRMAELKEGLEKADTHNYQVKEELKSTISRLNDARHRLRSCEKKLKGKEQNIDELRIRLDRCQGKIEEDTKHIKNLDEQVVVKGNEVEVRNGHIAQLEEIVVKKLECIDQLEGTSKNLEADLYHQAKHINTLSQQRQQAQEIINTSNREIGVLMDRVESTKGTIEESQGAMCEAKTETRVAHERTRYFEADVIELNQEMGNMIDENQTFRADLVALRNRFPGIKNQVERILSELITQAPNPNPSEKSLLEPNNLRTVEEFLRGLNFPHGDELRQILDLMDDRFGSHLLDMSQQGDFRLLCETLLQLL